MVLGLRLSSRRFLRFVRSARFLRGARRGPARPYLLAFSAHHPRPSSPPSRTHVLSCARRARSPPRWRQERLFNTLRWRCAAPAVTASCAASRLAERERRSTRHGTAPNIPRRARVLPALSPQSLLLTLSPRVSCAARPHVRRPSAAAGAAPPAPLPVSTLQPLEPPRLPTGPPSAPQRVAESVSDGGGFIYPCRRHPNALRS